MSICLIGYELMRCNRGLLSFHLSAFNKAAITAHECKCNEFKQGLLAYLGIVFSLFFF